VYAVGTKCLDVGMTLCPGKKQERSTSGINWRRDLRSDLQRLKDEYNVSVLVCLMEDEELVYYGVPDLFEMAETGFGMEVHHFPIEDGQYPTSLRNFSMLVDLIVARLSSGRTVVVHCLGGLGRSGTFCSSLLVKLLKNPWETAINTVRTARRGTVENDNQEDFVGRFEDYIVTKSLVPPAGTPHPSPIRSVSHSPSPHIRASPLPPHMHSNPPELSTIEEDENSPSSSSKRPRNTQYLAIP